MRTEFRFLLAVVLMMGVLVGTNLLFPPAPPPEGEPGQEVVDTTAVPADDQPSPDGAPPDADPSAPDLPGATADTPGVPGAGGEPPEIPEAAGDAGTDVAGPTDDVDEVPLSDVGAPSEEALVAVESPLYRYTFSTTGARVRAVELLEFESFTRDGPVQLIPGEAAALGHRLVVGSDTLDLRGVPFEVSPAEGLRLEAGEEAADLTFTYRHPTAPFQFSITYTFRPDSYIASARGAVEGLDGATLFTDLGVGLASNEQRPEEDLQALAYVGNHRLEGIDSWNLRDVEGESRLHEGPFLWAAFKSKYFVLALLPGADDVEGANLGGIFARGLDDEARVAVTTTQSVGGDDAFAYRVFMGPQDFARLTAIGDDLEDVNPYGWRFFRPVIRPLVGIVMAVLTFLHDTLGWGYGWVLILFGVMMRVLLFPLYQKSMRAQLKNMAVQPLLKEIQTKYKDQPEKLQKEMMKLYKEHGFNPLAGCLPMLLPWPVLITLFFVFQNTVELRGVEFLWLPDLSSPDPIYVLPVVLGLSMFLQQYISYRAMEDSNPQLKMMMWLMPPFMVFIFLRFAAGLNLYYVTSNLASLPQQFWIANERKKAQKHRPPVTTES